MIRESTDPMGAPPAFVGRDGDLASIVDALRDGPALVVIEGEPGIGKTSLVRRATEELTDIRTVLTCTAPPLSEPFPLGPIVDGIRRLTPGRVPVGLSPIAGALRPLFPEWTDQLPPALDPLDTAGATRHRVFRALTELLDRLEVSVLVLEDAHWADTATLELLLSLVATGTGDRSLVVTYRPAEVAESAPLLLLTSRAPVGMNRVRVELTPLSVEETGRLVGSMFGSDQVSTGFAAFLHEHTDGVPLAVEECVRLLADRRDIVRREGQWVRRVLGELAVPATVRDSVVERLVRLPSTARSVLEAAGVLGVPVDPPLLAEVADLSDSAARDGVAAALSSGLMQESGTGRFAFRHALDAQAVGEAMPASRRRHLHARAAAAVERLDRDALDRLIRHSREAGDTTSWCRYAEDGADVALQSGDDRNAVTLLLQLLALDHPVDRRLRLAAKLGEAVFYGGATLGDVVDRVIETIHGVLADDRLGASDRGELRLLLGRSLWRAGRQRTAFREFEAAVPDLSHRPDLAGMTMCNLAMPLVPEWPAVRHYEWLHRATELAATVEAPQLAVALSTARPSALLLLGNETAWDAVNLIDRPGEATARDSSLFAAGLLNVAAASLPWGRFDETRRLIASAKDHLPDSEHHRVAEGSQITAAILSWYTGTWDGLAEAMTGLARRETTEVHDRLLATVLSGLVRHVTGQHGDAGALGLAEVASTLRELGIAEPMTVVPAATLGRTALVDGDPEGALTLTGPAMDMVATKGVWLWATDLAVVHVEALARTGRRDQAVELVTTMADALDLAAAPAPAAAIAACRAVLAETAGDVDLAAQHYADSATGWAAIPRPYDELIALEGHGRNLLGAENRDTEEALAVLGRAQTGFAALGARRDADRVARRLRAEGADVARTWRRGRHGYGEELSPREREVLALVATGMTNREIGTALFLSPRTVGRHLSSAMRKLQVSTRTAAAMTAVETGLLDTPAPDGH
nr:helix-turn-helix transcriptional regulator [Nocardioides albus]